MAVDVALGDGRYAYAVRRRPEMGPIVSWPNGEPDDDTGFYPEPQIDGYEQIGWVPDLPPGFGSFMAYTRFADGTPLVRTGGPPTTRGQWIVVATIEPKGALFDTATYPADHPRITESIVDPFGPEGPSSDYVSAGDSWDFFDVTQWAIDGAKIPGKIKGVGT